MKKEVSHLILFTSTFPYGRGEQFIESEILYLANGFDIITIIPYSYGLSRTARSIPSNVKVFPPLKPEGFSPLKLFFKGVFNLTPANIFFRELLEKKCFSLRISPLILWFRHMLITRMLVADRTLKEIIDNYRGSTIVYFYWGRIHSAIIPFINKEIPTVVKFHGGDLYEERLETNGYIPFRRAVLQNLKTAVFISTDGKEYLERKYPDIPFQSKIFRLGVKQRGESKASIDSTLRIVTCSSLKRLKRVHILAEALQNLDFKVIWTHIGDGPEKELIDDIVKRYPENITVNFWGHIGNDLVYDFYQNNPVDLFINTSEYEGVPVSIMEALSFSIPVFGSAVGGIPEIIDGRVGKLLPLEITSDQLSLYINEFYYSTGQAKDEMRKQALERWKSLANGEVNYVAFTNYLKSLI